MEMRHTHQPQPDQLLMKQESPFDLFLCFGYKGNLASEHSVLSSFPSENLMKEGHSYISNLAMICFPDDRVPKQVKLKSQLEAFNFPPSQLLYFISTDPQGRQKYLSVLSFPELLEHPDSPEHCLLVKKAFVIASSRHCFSLQT